MRRFTIRLTIALCTFLVGVSVTAALMINSHSPHPLPPAPPPAPPADPHRPSLEMVFVLDTTGSMSGLLEGAKSRIWGIVNDVMKAQTRPVVRIGLVAYRDVGDEYVTKVTPLTSDLDHVYATLMSYRADGGGDTPENVRRALSDGVLRAGWSQTSANVAQIVFLVGDAPPHDDYQNEPSTAETVAAAVHRGMIVNTIQCGRQAETREVWQTIARRGEGQYFAIAQDGGVQTVTTPYDGRLAELGNQLGGTFVAYGGAAKRAETRARQMAMESRVVAAAPAAAAADRAVNKAINSEAYADDLMQALENGSVEPAKVKKEELPEELQRMDEAERGRELERRLAERRKIREEILSVSKQRDEYLAAERRKQGAAGQQAGFDVAVAEALKSQLGRKGIRF